MMTKLQSPRQKGMGLCLLKSNKISKRTNKQPQKQKQKPNKKKHRKEFPRNDAFEFKMWG